MTKDKSKNGKIGAFFDVDGTLAASNIVEPYVHYRLCNRSPLTKALWMLGFAPKLPYYFVTDLISRKRFNQIFFRNYEGVYSAHFHGWVSSEGQKYWSRRLFPLALEEIRKHQGQGHIVILVTGGLAEMVKPLTDMLRVDHCLAVDMITSEGYLTGNLTGEPLTGIFKALEVQRIVANWGLDVTRSYGYADSYADKAFLETVGHPVVVNPDCRLRRLAVRRGWDTKSWKKSDKVEER